MCWYLLPKPDCLAGRSPCCCALQEEAEPHGKDFEFENLSLNAGFTYWLHDFRQPIYQPCLPHTVVRIKIKTRIVDVKLHCEVKVPADLCVCVCFFCFLKCSSFNKITLFKNENAKKCIKRYLVSICLFPRSALPSLQVTISVGFCCVSRVSQCTRGSGDRLCGTSCFHSAYQRALEAFPCQCIATSVQLHYLALSGCSTVYLTSSSTSGTWGVAHLLLVQTIFQ